MLKRKIEKNLLSWKNTAGHKPLIIKGCRQCGKTFSVLDFAKKNYKNVVYLNFYENPDYASVFSGSLEINNIVMMLSALLGDAATFETGNTVLVLDEIQDCPEARIELLEKSLENETPVPETLHIRMRKLFLQYAVVGGNAGCCTDFCGYAANG